MITQSFNAQSPAKIHPSAGGRPLDCAACIITFSHIIEDYVLSRYPHREFARLEQSSGPLFLYEIEYRGHVLAFGKTTVGAPAAAGFLEEAAARVSPKRFVVFGGAGCLNREIAHGKVMVPAWAYRDEGTSYHYAQAADRIDIKNCRAVADYMAEQGIPYVVGGTWTTDAFFRETEAAFQKRKGEGCISVEMECSALQAVCDFRGYELYSFLTSGDLLDAPKWDMRREGSSLAGTQHDTTHFEIAAELACWLSRRTKEESSWNTN